MRNCNIWLGAAAIALALTGAFGRADAQTYPNRTITLVIPFAPGGSTSIVGRVIADKMSQLLGQSIVVDNRPGAGGTVGTKYVAKSDPDGYTLLLGYTGTLAIGPSLYKEVGYDPTKDFAPIGMIGNAPSALVVHPSFPAHTVAELISYAKANPGKLTFAHTGPGGLPHLTGELFKALAGVDILGVSYKSGGESVAAVLGHKVDMTFESVTILLPLIRDGKLRALAITSHERTPLAPDLPTMIEAGVPDYEVTSFNGIVAPAGTPPTVVNLLNKTINDGLATPEDKEAIAHLGAISNPGSPQDFAAFIAAQHRKWLQVAKSAHISID
jgi:tripartite-type tricarboxylate transporter receptor subunit TctC